MKNRKGFTIVELVIVIAVIAILAAVLIPTFSGVMAKANASAVQQTAMQAVKAGLLMVNTAQLPPASLVLVDSDKNSATAPDFAFVYDGSALGKAQSPEKNNAFDSTLLGEGTNYVFVSDKALKSDNKVDATLATALRYIKGESIADTTDMTYSTDADSGVTTITIKAAAGEVPAVTINVAASPDMPTNAFVFLKMGA